jgi:hypothetical protein
VFLKDSSSFSIVPHKTGGEFMCSGKIAVLSLLVLHKTGSEFMCSGKISVLSLLVPHKTGGEFMLLLL